MLDHVKAWGDPESPTVVLLPGAGGTQWLWTPHAELLDDEYRILSMDMPAHGRHPDSSFTFDRAIDDIGVLLDENGPAVLVGHSLGGHVAMEAAAAHENQVDGLLVAGVNSAPGLLAGGRQWVLSCVIEVAAHSTHVRSWMDEQYGLDDDQQVPPDEVETHDEAVATARGMRGALFRDSLSALNSYDGPTLLAYGEDEAGSETVEKLAERVGARLRWYDGEHGLPSREPAVFSEIIEEFLTTVYDGNPVALETS